MLKAFSRASAPFVFATAALSLFAVHCGSDDPAPGPTGGTSAGGTAGAGVSGSATGGGGSSTGGSGTSGAATGGGGSGTGGSAGAATGGGGAGGAGGGAGGAGGGAGGAGGSGGAAGGGGAGGAGGTGGAPGATFAQVKELLGNSCAVGNCHNEPSQHIDWDTETGLYGRLTTVIGDKGADCKGSTPVVANDANSLLIRIVKGGTMCVGNNNNMQEIPRMPFMCGQGNNPACLTDAQVKIISDWVAAGAPQ